MKRNLSICIFLFFIVLFLISMMILFNDHKESEQLLPDSQETQNSESETVINSNKEIKSYQYIILEDQGRLSVYCSDNKTLYMNTGIPVNALTDELKGRLPSGICFETEDELYEFLENYSS